MVKLSVLAKRIYYGNACQMDYGRFILTKDYFQKQKKFVCFTVSHLVGHSTKRLH